MRKSYYIISLLVLFFVSLFLYAFSGGITGATRKNGNGCTCHGTSASVSVMVNITGPDTLQVNDSANYSVTLSGGPLVMGGTNISVNLGTLIPGEGLRKFDNELTHIAPFPPDAGTVTFNFIYKSPSVPGTGIIYANGNSVNFNGFSTGDNWNYAPNKTIVITPSTGVINNNSTANSFVLNQNYPNPFNPSTIINYSIPKRLFVNLSVYDSSGKLLENLVNSTLPAGAHKIVWSADKFPNGVYFYTLKSGENIITKKMMLIK